MKNSILKQLLLKIKNCNYLMYSDELFSSDYSLSSILDLDEIKANKLIQSENLNDMLLTTAEFMYGYDYDKDDFEDSNIEQVRVSILLNKYLLGLLSKNDLLVILSNIEHISSTVISNLITNNIITEEDIDKFGVICAIINSKDENIYNATNAFISLNKTEIDKKKMKKYIKSIAQAKNLKSSKYASYLAMMDEIVSLDSNLGLFFVNIVSNSKKHNASNICGLIKKHGVSMNEDLVPYLELYGRVDDADLSRRLTHLINYSIENGIGRSDELHFFGEFIESDSRNVLILNEIDSLDKLLGVLDTVSDDDIVSSKTLVIEGAKARKK